MKCFHCNACEMMVFFENSRCVKCGGELGFLPDVLELSTLKPAVGIQWQAGSPAAQKRLYRHCANRLQHNMCNWMVPVEDPDSFCTACRLNKTIPDLSNGKNLERWEKLEMAKRRCLYTLIELGLPLGDAAAGDRPALSFRFLEDQPNAPVKTGHENGVITVNIAEADGDERERRRLTFHEPYRTLVGHFRHESGHFYWDRLIVHSPHLKRFRELFGDETGDYDAALNHYYQQGAAAGWPGQTVTAYASAHPWEDWAETWAHYLHIMDTLETAANFGMKIQAEGLTTNEVSQGCRVTFERHMDFDVLMEEWTPLTCALNCINRGMGLGDLYPFVIPPAVAEKLRFIHSVVLETNRPVQPTGQKRPVAEMQPVAA